jgi:hypothetical protein
MRLIQRLAVLGVALVMVAACSVVAYSYQLKRHANHMLRIARELSLGERPPTVQDLRRLFGDTLKQPKPCTAYGCGYEILISNRPLVTLHLASYTVLRLYFWATNGVIDENSIEFWSLPRRSGMVLSSVEMKYCNRCTLFRIYPSSDSSPLGETGSIEIGYASDPREKQIVFALGTGCLTRFSGCSTIAEMFPKVWLETPARTIRCRLPNHEGVVSGAP